MPNPTATVMIPYHALDDVIQRGTRAAQPAASAVTPGTLYSVTDEGHLVERSNGTVWDPFAPSGGTMTLPYNFATATQPPPGSKRVSVDSATYAAATRVYFDPVDNDNFDVRGVLAQVAAGTTIYIQATSDAAQFLRLAASGLATDAGTYLEIPVTYVAAGGVAFANNAAVRVILSGGGAGGGGTAPGAHHATHEPGGSDALVAAAWTSQENMFNGDQTIDGDLLVTGTITPMTAAQRDRINALIGDPTGARTLMSSSFVSGLSLRHDEGLEIGRITCGNYDTQTYQPLIVEVESFQVHSGVSPSVRVEHVRVHPSGGVTVGAGADHASDPGVGIVKARGLDGTPLDASQATSGILPDARLSSNVPRLNTANVFTANQWVEKRLTLNDPTQAANQKRWDLTAAGPTAGSLSLYPVDDNSTGQFTNGIVLQRTGSLTAPGGLSSTPLNATQLTSGTVPDARLSANVQMKPVAQSDVTNLVSDLAAKAPLASPALTGTPTAPTATAGTSTTQVATTAFVQATAVTGQQRCVVYHNTTQAILTGTYTPASFNAEDFDSSNMHDGVGSPTIVTVPSLGGYLINGHVVFPANGTGTRQLFLKVAGAYMVGAVATGSAAGSVTVFIPPTLLTLNAGTALGLDVFQDSGATLSVGSATLRYFMTEMSVVRMW